MAKIKNPLLSLGAIGNLTKSITFALRRKTPLVEKYPIPKDAKTSYQLAWRTMYQLAIDLWHALSPAEKREWESAGTARHMTGFAWFMSQALRPNPGLYLPLLGGTMQGNIDMASHNIFTLPDPTNPQDPATKAYADLFTLLATFNTHEPGITGIHGVGDSVIDSTFARNAAITTHADDPDAHHTRPPAAPILTLSVFQTNPATGTALNPARLNDNSTVAAVAFDDVGEYAEVDFGTDVSIFQWRHYGNTDNNGSGRFKIEYYDGSWHDWVTDIPARTVETWSEFSHQAFVVCSKIRLTCTTVDTGVGASKLQELEVMW